MQNFRSRSQNLYTQAVIHLNTYIGSRGFIHKSISETARVLLVDGVYLSDDNSVYDTLFMELPNLTKDEIYEYADIIHKYDSAKYYQVKTVTKYAIEYTDYTYFKDSLALEKAINTGDFADCDSIEIHEFNILTGKYEEFQDDITLRMGNNILCCEGGISKLPLLSKDVINMETATPFDCLQACLAHDDLNDVSIYDKK